MKIKLVLLTAALMIYYFKTLAQDQQLDVTFFKTTSIVFAYPIMNVDRGSRNVIAQKVNGVDNILQIKAAQKGFPETDLTVVTADGRLHHFYVSYSDEPATQTFIVDSMDMVKFKNHINVKEFEEKADRIKNDKHHVIERMFRYKMKFSLNGIYVDDDVIFYRLSVKNKSNINFDIQSLRFFIRDKVKLKRTAWQEDELLPLFVRDNQTTIKGNDSATIIYALRKFTIPNAKTLDIELFEKNAGRNLKLRIDNQTIVKAERLP